MNKFARMIDVLDLFSEEDPLLTAEEIASSLQISRPTAFRYVRELNAVGFLANYSGRYSLGARIITLDYRIRGSDPVLRVARDAMRRLSAETACSSILCRMYNEEVINVHAEAGYDVAGVTFGRGRPLPLFRGSASKTMLAYLPTGKLKKIYANHCKNDDLLTFADDWLSFKRYFDRIREAGHYVSYHEVDKGVIGIAAPICVPRVGVVAVISLVFSEERKELIDTEGLASIVKLRAGEVAQQLNALAISTDKVMIKS